MEKDIDEIMADYGEQRNEWTCVPPAPDSICHPNGKTFICEQYKGYIVSDKQIEALAGKSIEQQMEHYYVTESYRLYSTAYGEITNERLSERAEKLCDYKGVKALLVRGDLLVGARIKGYFGDGILLPERCVCTYYASDNNGAGTKDREDYAYLIFTEQV